MTQSTDEQWAYISYDDHGVWTTRAPASDPWAGQINLEADWPEGVLLVIGQRVGLWMVPETRRYSVAEIVACQERTA